MTPTPHHFPHILRSQEPDPPWGDRTSFTCQISNRRFPYKLHWWNELCPSGGRLLNTISLEQISLFPMSSSFVSAKSAFRKITASQVLYHSITTFNKHIAFPMGMNITHFCSVGKTFVTHVQSGDVIGGQVMSTGILISVWQSHLATRWSFQSTKGRPSLSSGDTFSESE